MNPVVLGEDAAFVYKDAIFFSGHKFIGGPGDLNSSFVSDPTPQFFYPSLTLFLSSSHTLFFCLLLHTRRQFWRLNKCLTETDHITCNLCFADLITLFASVRVDHYKNKNQILEFLELNFQ